MAANLVSAKVSVFYSKIAKTSPKSSQRFYFAQRLLKHKNTSKQRLYELFITKQEKKAKNKNKIGLPPNKRYRLTPLARHKARIDLGIAIFSRLVIKRKFLI